MRSRRGLLHAAQEPCSRDGVSILAIWNITPLEIWEDVAGHKTKQDVRGLAHPSYRPDRYPIRRDQGTFAATQPAPSPNPSRQRTKRRVRRPLHQIHATSQELQTRDPDLGNTFNDPQPHHVCVRHSPHRPHPSRPIPSQGLVCAIPHPPFHPSTLPPSRTHARRAGRNAPTGHHHNHNPVKATGASSK